MHEREEKGLLVVFTGRPFSWRSRGQLYISRSVIWRRVVGVVVGVVVVGRVAVVVLVVSVVPVVAWRAARTRH